MDYSPTPLMQSIYKRIDGMIPISSDEAELKTRAELLNAAVGTAIAIEEWEKLRTQLAK